MPTLSLRLLTVLSLLGSAACTPTPPPMSTAYKMTPGARFKWKTLCATCHGRDGKGDGAAGLKLNPRPRDFGDAKWQASVTDEHLARVILEGGVAVGKSKDMPANPDLKPRPRDLKSLVGKIRSFGPKPAKKPKTGSKPTPGSKPKQPTTQG